MTIIFSIDIIKINNTNEKIKISKNVSQLNHETDAGVK